MPSLDEEPVQHRGPDEPEDRPPAQPEQPEPEPEPLPPLPEQEPQPEPEPTPAPDMGLEKQYAIHEQFPAEPLPEEPPGQRPPSKPSRYERVVVRRPCSQDVIERLRGIVRSIFARKYRRQIETPQPLVSESSQGQGSRELGPMKTERLNRRTRGKKRLAHDTKKELSLIQG